MTTGFLLAGVALNLAHATVSGQWSDAFYLSPGCDGTVHAVAERADGRIYVAGDFLFCDGVKVNRLALFNPGSNTFEPLLHGGEIGVSDTIFALSWVDGDLFAGGSFKSAGSLDANGIARWDGSAWHRLGTAASNGVDLSSPADAQVLALAWNDGQLFVGGRFDSAGSTDANGIARWSGEQWHTLGQGTGNGVMFGNVNALASAGSSIVVGGSFTSAGGAMANRLARWDGTTWSTIGQGGDHGPGFNNAITALLIEGDDLFVGGLFSFVDSEGNSCERCVMRWDGEKWQALPAGPAGLRSLEMIEGVLYAGGRDPMLSRWLAGQWQQVGVTSGLNGHSVRSLLASGSAMWVGGSFGTADDIPANGLVRYEDNQFRSVGEPGGLGLAEGVWTMTEHQGKVHVSLGPEVIRWDGTQWSRLPGRFLRSDDHSDGAIFALTSYQGMLYAGGRFGEVDGQSVRGIARFDGAQWHPVGDGIQGQSESDTFVRGFIEIDEKLYVTGKFTKAGEVTANGIATWEGSAWGALASSSGVGLEVDGQGQDAGGVALAARNGILYVAGVFNLAGGQPVNNVASWDGANWSDVGGGIDSSNSKQAMVWHDDVLYLATGFHMTGSGGNELGTLAGLVNDQWLPIGPMLENSGLVALHSHQGWLYVGGSRLQAADEAMLARFDGNQWQRFGEGLAPDSGVVVDIVRIGDQLFVGGEFSQAGPFASHDFAVFEFSAPDQIFLDRFQNGPAPTIGQTP